MFVIEVHAEFLKQNISVLLQQQNYCITKMQLSPSLEYYYQL